MASGLNTILPVRRLSCTLAAFLLVAPAGLRLAASAVDSDWEAVRCAIACGHAAKAGAKGAACCPMGAADGPTMTACPSKDSAPAAPLPAGQLAILDGVPPLAAPEGGSSPSTLAPDAPRDALARPPDHVPILLS